MNINKFHAMIQLKLLRMRHALGAVLSFALLLLVPNIAAAEDIGPEQAAERLAELRAQFGTHEDRYMDIEGVEVAYRDEGEGDVILLIHGSASNLRSLDPLAQVLKKNFRVIRYDVPPFGLSGPVEQLDLSGIAPEDIPAKLLTRLEVEKATIVGTSYGGSIALSLAAAFPDLVDRLVISNAPSDPVPEMPTVGPSYQAMLDKYGGAGDILRSRPPEFWQVWYEYYYGEPERIRPEFAHQTANLTRPMPSRNVLALISTVSDNDAVREKYALIEGPVLLLWGGRDPMLPGPMATTLAGYLPNAQVSTLIMPDVGHYPLMEVPERYAGMLEAYIRLATPVQPVSAPPHER